MAQTFSAKEAAIECGTDARTLRKFLREFLPQEEQPGQGGRYSFTKGEITKFKKAFSTWSAKGKAATADAPPAKKGKKAKAEAPPVEELTEDELIDLADLDDPDDDELETTEDDVEEELDEDEADIEPED